MSFLRKIFGLSPKVDYHELIANGAILIDVRTPSEYSNGKPKNSKNIPLDKIEGIDTISGKSYEYIEFKFNNKYQLTLININIHVKTRFQVQLIWRMCLENSSTTILTKF